MDIKVKKGHIVNVHFVRSPSIFGAKVLYTPQATGDSWHLETKEGVIYVQLFEKMEIIGCVA